MEVWLRETIGVKKPITQIYNGVDADFFSPSNGVRKIRGELDIPPGAFLMGIVGRLDPIKNHETLFRAFGTLRERLPDVHLLVIGDGPERKRLEALAGDGVFFLGNRLDVPEILRTLDVFVLSSRNEGISKTILEAMATAVPVVATHVGGNPELVEHGRTGFLVEPGDFQAMASAILRYADNPELRIAHGQTGRKRVLENFTIEKMVRSYEEVYRRVAKMQGTGVRHKA